MLHKIKILRDFADAICEGSKNFEIRKNDRGYQKGDHIIFSVIENEFSTIPLYHHDIYGNEYEITYVMSGYGLKEGYVVFGIKEIV